MTFTAQQLANITGGRLIAGPAGLVLCGEIGTDSRKATPGGTFFALTGERFDGHDYARQAVAGGAAAVVVSRPLPQLAEDGQACAVVLVDDTLAALQQLASWHRQTLTRLKVVGITGSSGKTSTKDLIKAVLSLKYKVAATRGNLNNHIGVPLSVLQADSDDDIAVWEMGMNHPGELEPLCRITRPLIGVIPSIGTAHIEYFDSRDAIAREKCTLPSSLPADGVMIFPADDHYADMISASTEAHCISVGSDRGEIRAEAVKTSAEGTHFTLVTPTGRAEVKLPLHGMHMVSNALLAAAVGQVFDLSVTEIAQGLEHAQLTGGRFKCLQHKGITIIDDTYNANPESMSAAMQTVASMPASGRRLAILGMMGEQGAHARRAHEDTGRQAIASGFDIIISVGEQAKDISTGAALAAEGTEATVIHFDTREQASNWLVEQLRTGDLALVKGSRSAGMDRLIDTILAHIH